MSRRLPGTPRIYLAITIEVEGAMKRGHWQGSKVLVRYLFWLLCAATAGCFTGDAYVQQEAPIPRELRMTTLPTYRIEPPDILLITMMTVVPKPPYRILPLDVLFVQVNGTPPDKPITGPITVEPDGRLNFGLDYGSVYVSGLTLDQAKQKIEEYLKKNVLKEAQVQVSLARSRALQQVQGDHIVRMDGTIGLGVYGSVYITGMTIDEARRAIEAHLSQYLLDPEVSLDIYAYNSKWYYLIEDRAGFGQTIMRLPITGRDTVLDALSMMGGTIFFASNRHVSLARPNGQDPNAMQIFPVNLPALVRGGSPATNYQLLPGDRLFVHANPLLTANNRLNQFLMPLERASGFTLLETGVISGVQGIGRAGGAGAVR